MKLFCDEMLKGLARWLRAAGHDVRLPEPGMRDRDMLKLARSEQRTMISRDRKLLEFRDADRDVVWLAANDLDACARELTGRLGVDWQWRPFSRCLICNLPLESAPDQLLEQVPADIRDEGQPLLWCPGCRRLYWEGGHVRRMRARLASWNGAPD